MSGCVRFRQLLGNEETPKYIHVKYWLARYKKLRTDQPEKILHSLIELSSATKWILFVIHNH